MSDKEDLEREWFGTLPDAERADVLKVLISERGQTRRAEVEAQRQTDADRQKSDGFHVIRGLTLFAIVIIVSVCGAVTCHAIDIIYTPPQPVFGPPSPRPVSAPTTAASVTPVPTASASADAK